MYPINSAILAKYQNGDKQYARITIGSTVIGSDRIMQGGFNVNRLSETDDTVKIGSCSAAEFTLVLNNRDGAYDDYDFIGKEAYVEVGVEYNGAVSYLPIGYFIFDEAGYDKSALRLASLDRMIKFERTIDPTQLTFPMTVTQLLGRLCTVCGVPLGTFPTLLNGGISIPSLPKDAKTYRDLLVWIAEISGNVAYIDYSGNLMLGWYNGSQFRITPDIRRDGTLERGSILVTGVEIVVNDTTILQGTNARTIRVENNPLIPAGQESFIATGLFNKVGGFSYTPFSAAVLPMPHIFPLDGATYVTASGDETYVPITDWTFTLNGGTKIAGAGNQATYRRGYGLADAILQGVNLADKAVTTDKIADNAVDTAQLAALAVKEGQLATDAVTTSKIKNEAIIGDKIYGGTITGDKIAALTILAGNIASGQITTDKIDTGAVTAEKIYVDDLYTLYATIGGWTIDENALKKTVPGAVGGDNGVWLNAPSGSLTNASAMDVRDDEDSLSIKYDGSLVSTQNLTGVHQQTTKLDDGELFVERKYYKTEGDWSSEWRRGETNINGAEIEVLNSKRDNTETRDEPLFRGELSGYSNNAVVSVEANTTNGRSEVYAIAEDQSASLALDAYDVSFSLADGRSNRIRMERSDIWNMWYHGSTANRTTVTHIAEGMLAMFTTSGDQRDNRPSTPSDATVMTASSFKVQGKDMLRSQSSLINHFATDIPSGANLNDTTYLTVGRYRCASNATAQSQTNCPTIYAYYMEVGETISVDRVATTNTYMVQTIVDLVGQTYRRGAYRESGSTFNYTDWRRVITSTDVFDIPPSYGNITTSTTLSYTGKYITIPTAGWYAVTAYANWVNSAPAAISIVELADNYYYERAYAERHTGYDKTNNYLWASCVGNFTANHQLRLWAKYLGASTNGVYIAAHKLP